MKKHQIKKNKKQKTKNKYEYKNTINKANKNIQ
jgi:hypothetical protein